MYKALTIAGSDSCGGAGIQADIKTMTALGVYGMSAITALTAQNTTGVKEIREVDAKFLRNQLDCVFDDIFPDAVKTGMIPNTELITTVAEVIKERAVKRLVIDPVMVSTSGHALIDDEAIKTLKTKLLPLGELVTPNIPEAEVITGLQISSTKDIENAAKLIYEKYGCNVLVKGGHGTCDANDFLYGRNLGQWINHERIDNPNTHGTGCTLSSAIASFMAMGKSLDEAVFFGKEYLSGAILAGLDLGKGPGPLNHMYAIAP